MATDLERLVVQLSADIKGYERAMAKAQGITTQRTKAIQTQFSKMNKGLSTEFMGVGKSFVAAFAAGAALKGIQSLSDAATRITNALKVAGLSGEELERVYGKLRDSALANAAPIEALVTLYGRASQVQKELGVSTDELLKFTDNVSVALRVAGTDAQTASGALLQLSQALGGGTVRAEEFNSMLEGALPIVQAAAAGIKEAGGNVSKLRALVNDGKVSSAAFFRGFEAGATTLQEKVAGATLTTAQAFGNLETSLIDVFREFNEATGASENFANGINTVAQAIGKLDVTGFIEKIRSAKAELDSLLAKAGNAQIFKDFNEAVGITNDGALVNPQVEDARVKVAGMEREITLLQQTIEKNTNLGFSNVDAISRLTEVRAALAALKAEAANLAPTIAGIKADGTIISEAQTNGLMGGSTIRGGKRNVPAVAPVSLADFPVTGSKTGGSKTKTNEFDEAVKSANEATTALTQQEAALRKLSGTEADFATKVTAVEKAQDLLTAAQKGGKAVGKELSDVNQLLYGDLSKLSPAARVQAESIRNLSLSYADATTKLDKLKEAQDKAAKSAKEAIEFQKDLVNGALSDMRTALEDGKLTWEDLGNVAVNVLNKIADRLQTMLVDQLFAKGFGGFFGSLTGLGGAVIGGVSGTAGVGSGPAAAMAKAPQMPNLAAAKASSQEVHVFIDDDGGLRGYVQKEGRRTEARVLARSEAARRNYVRGEMTKDVNRQVRKPRRTGGAK